VHGEVVWFFAYDVAREVRLDRVAAALSGRSEFRRARSDPRAPRGTTLYAPLVVEMEPVPMPGLPGAPLARRTVKIFAVGAVSVELRLPFEAASLGEVLPLRNADEDESSGMERLARASTEEILGQIGESLVRPDPRWERGEDYVAVCITAGHEPAADGGSWLERNSRAAAALLLGEARPEELSEQQVAESLRMAYSYGRDDLAVVDWDAMILVDTPEDCAELLYLAEIANMQMAELRVHDEILSRVVERAYDDLEAHQRRPLFFRMPSRLAYTLREQRVDLASMADEILNLSKYFGDWYLARVYSGLRNRFHLGELEEQLERKLRTVDALYELIRRDITDRRMLVLEVMIVGLFVIDIILILMGKT
jgi:hypothetical protein